ncbi:unnamed protein product [Calypogeia fissa]
MSNFSTRLAQMEMYRTNGLQLRQAIVAVVLVDAALQNIMPPQRILMAAFLLPGRMFEEKFFSHSRRGRQRLWQKIL